MSRRPPRRAVKVAWWGHGDLATSLVLVVPLLFAYEVGVLFSSSVNGADLITRAIYAASGHRRAVYLTIHAALAIGFLVWLHRSRRARALELEVVGPVVLEATIYALTLGSAISLVVHDVLGLGAGLAAGGHAIVAALGAGVHEELVFRLGMFLGGAALVRKLLVDARVGERVAGRAAWFVALVVSSLAFAGAHHLGAAGEPWSADIFAFRALAGAAFAAIAWYRSLAHAVYAHVLYDLYVAVVR
jgi:hypothetical protein